MNREIEIKYRVDTSNFSYLELIEELDDLLFADVFDVIRDRIAVDTFWKTPKPDSFLRLRHQKTGEADLTYKEKDKGSNQDRLEIVSKLYDYKNMEKILNLAIGPKEKVDIEKEFTVFQLLEGSEICVYEITHNWDTYLFLEIEGPSLESIEPYKKKLEKRLKDMIQVEPRSLYEMFVQGEN